MTVKIDTKQRWYYDACVLDSERYRDIYGEIVNKNNLRDNYVSHLAIGEAYGKCLCKGEDQANAFIGLINKLKDFIKIVGNDARNNVFVRVREVFRELKLSDSLHLTTAISYKCDTFKTADHDLYSLDEKEVAELSEELSGSKLKIKQVKF